MNLPNYRSEKGNEKYAQEKLSGFGTGRSEQGCYIVERHRLPRRPRRKDGRSEERILL